MKHKSIPAGPRLMTDFPFLSQTAMWRTPSSREIKMLWPEPVLRASREAIRLGYMEKLGIQRGASMKVPAGLTFLATHFAEHASRKTLGGVIVRLSEDLMNNAPMLDMKAFKHHEIRFPCSSFYVHFDAQDGAIWQGGEVLCEGTYVGVTDEMTTLTFTFRPGNPSEKPEENLLPYFTVVVANPVAMGGKGPQTLHDAIRMAIEHDSFGDELSNGLNEDDRDGLLARQFQPAMHNLVMRAISRFYDCWSFIQEQAQQICESRQRIGPEEAWAAIELATNPKEERRLRAKAEGQGIVTTRLYDLLPDAQIRALNLNPERRGSPSVSYLRRGHYRTVRCGKGRMERKVVWIDETMCNEAAEGRVEARTYQV